MTLPQPNALLSAELSAAPAPKGPRLHLAYIDGIRGVAALYVVLQHIYIALTFLVVNINLTSALATTLGDRHVHPRIIALTATFLSHCFFMPVVQVFIVLSGYCLMLPVVPANGVLRGGFRRFMERRATRILPPYFAMLIISMGICAVLDGKHMMPVDLHDLSFGKVISHLFLVHNWSPTWSTALDPPMWSIAVEWQIYFLFPILLLPVWRRFGGLVAVAVGFVVGVAPHFLLHGFLDWSFPWFLGLFALGMAAAHLSLSEQPRVRVWQERVPWGYLSVALWVCVIGVGVLKNGWGSHHAYFTDALVGLATMSLLVSCTRASLPAHADRWHFGVRLLSARPIAGLGEFSYSLYLAHYPLMRLFFFTSLLLPMSVLARSGLMFAVFLPLVIAFSYGFFVLFERPFIRHGPKRASATQAATADAAH